MSLSTDDILLALWMNRNLERKEFKKYMLKLAKRGIPVEYASFFRKLIDNPKAAAKEIETFIFEIDDTIDVTNDIVRAGHQGIAEVGNTIYPVDISFEDEGDQEWANLNEEQVALAIAHATRKALQRERIIVSITLFPRFGFSGVYMEFDVKRNNPLQTRVKVLN